MIDRDEPPWINGHSTPSGRNDRVPTDAAADLDDSLCLIRVDALTVSVSEPLRPSADFPDDVIVEALERQACKFAYVGEPPARRDEWEPA